MALQGNSLEVGHAAGYCVSREQMWFWTVELFVSPVQRISGKIGVAHACIACVWTVV